MKGPSLLTLASGYAVCFTLVSNDRQHPGHPAGVLAGRLARRAADPTAQTTARPRPAAARQHRRTRRARTGPSVGQGRHRRSRLLTTGGTRRTAGAAGRFDAGADREAVGT